MTLSDYKKILIDLIEGNLLKRIPKQLPPEKAPTTFSSNSYQLTFIGLGNPTPHISNNYLWSYKFNLELVYVCMTDVERMDSEENFVTVLKSIISSPYFHGIIGDEIPFTAYDSDKKKYKATITFYFGVGS